MRPSSRGQVTGRHGITTLEVVLAVTAGTLLILGFLGFYGREQASLVAVLSQGRAPAAGSELATAVVQELHNIQRTLAGVTVSTIATGVTGDNLAVDAAGNVYVVKNTTWVQKLTAPGYAVSTFATGFTTADGIAYDSGDGNLYVGDTTTDNLSRLTTAGALAVLFTCGTGMETPMALAADPSGYLIAGADFSPVSCAGVGSPVQRVTLAGPSRTVLHSGGGNTYSSAAIDAAGFVYLSDNWGPSEASNHNTVWKMAPDGSTFTALLTAATPVIGGAAMGGCQGLAIDRTWNVLYVADKNNNRILQVPLSSGAVTVLAGDPAGALGNLDGPGTFARFNLPTGLALDGQGNLYVADSSNNSVRKITITRASIAMTAASSQSFTFTTSSGGTETIRYNPGAQRLEVNRGAGFVPLTPNAPSLVVNGGTPLGPLLAPNGQATTSGVPVFTYLDGGSPANDLDVNGQVAAASVSAIARIQVYLALQQGPRSAPTYLRTSIVPR